MFAITLKAATSTKAIKRSASMLPRKVARMLHKLTARVNCAPRTQTSTTITPYEPLVTMVYQTKHACLAQQVTELTNEHQQLTQELRTATRCAVGQKTRLAQLTTKLDALTTANHALASANTEAQHRHQDLARALSMERHTAKQALRAEDLAHFLVLEALAEVESQITTDAQDHSELFAEWQGVYSELTKRNRGLQAEKRRIEDRAVQQRRALLDFAREMKRPAADAV